MARFDNLKVAPLNPINTPPVPGETILLKAKAVADTEQRMVREIMGMPVSEADQLYRNGTKMLECGEKVAQALREQYEKLPMFDDVLASTQATVEAEQREDIALPLMRMRLDENGVFQGHSKPLHLTGNGMMNLASFGPDAMDASLRYNVNGWLGSSQKSVAFRTRNPNKKGARSVYAVVSQKYAKLDLDDVCKELKGALPQDAHGEAFYDGSRWSLSAELAPTFEVGELGVGRLFRVVCKVSGADDRTKGLKAVFQAKRIRCINCTTITNENLIFSQRHSGNVVGMFQQAIKVASKAMEMFASKWREANEKSIVDKADGSKLSPQEIFTRLVAHGYVKVPGFQGKKGGPELVNHLLSVWNKEPLESAAGINMALTRFAHEGMSLWASPWVTESLEAQAGDLLFQNVYRLPPLTDRQAEAFAA